MPPAVSSPCVIPRERAQKRRPLLRLRPDIEIVYRPRQPPRPVLVVHDRGQVDAVAPAEEVLERDDDDVRAGTEKSAKERIAGAGAERGARIAASLAESGDFGAEVTFLRAGVVPPFGERFGIVRAADSHRFGTVPRRIAEGLARAVPFALPPQHFETRDAQTPQRLPDEVRDEAEILGNDLRAGLLEDPHDALALGDLRWFVGRREVCAAVGLAYERAVEADQMIDAKSIVELAAAPRPLPQPGVVPFGKTIPAIDRQPPVLTGLREGVRRRTDRRVETELMLSRPDIGAVAAH